MKILNYLLIVGGIVLLTSNSKAQNLEIKINEPLKKYTSELVTGFDEISQDRKDKLREIGNYLSTRLQEQNNYSVLFVCTHNSRRSHIADTWFKYAMTFYGISQFESYSGGLEATKFNSNAIAALERAGFTIAYDKKVSNPAVSITPGNYPVWRMKSKVYTHQINPKSNFTAIMVCSDADKSCPVVKGAEQRFSLPFDDPRYYEVTPSQDIKYDETVAEIGREMFYLSDYIKSQIIIQLEAAK